MKDSGIEMDNNMMMMTSTGNDANNVDDDEYNSDDSDEGEEHHLDPHTCRGKLGHFLETKPIQYGIIALVVIDSLIVVLELLIDTEIITFPDGQPPSTEAPHTTRPLCIDLSHITTAPTHSEHNDTSAHDNHSTSGEHHPHHSHAKEETEHILHVLSLSILSVFMVEVCLKIYVERSAILKKKAEVFDAIVVIVSFNLDVVFSFISVTKTARDAAGFMVVLRLWRVTRIINGVIVSVKREADNRLAAQKKITRTLQKENKKFKAIISRLENENIKLKAPQPDENNSSSPRGNQSNTLPSPDSVNHAFA